MEDIFVKLESVGFFRQGKYQKKLKPKKNEDIVRRMRKSGEIPIAFVDALDAVENKHDKLKAALSLDKIFTYAKSKFHDSSAVAKWMINGSIPGQKGGALRNMSGLFKSAKQVQLIHKQVKDLESKIRTSRARVNKKRRSKADLGGKKQDRPDLLEGAGKRFTLLVKLCEQSIASAGSL